MPLKTPEEKQNAVKWVVSQLKVFGVTFVAAIATVWGVAEVYLEDYVKDTAISVIEEKQGNKSFREVLGEEMDIPTDMVPYHLTAKIVELDSLIEHVKSFESKYLPVLVFQEGVIPLYRYVDIETGQEYQMMKDNRPHPILIDDNGIKWIVYSNKRLNLSDI